MGVGNSLTFTPILPHPRTQTPAEQPGDDGYGDPVSSIINYRITNGPSELAPRILVIRLSSIGDVVMSTGVVELLRRYYPNAHIAWAVEQRSAEVILGNPYIDEVIVWPRVRSIRRLSEFAADASEMVRYIRELRAKQFDIAVDLQGLARSAVVMAGSGAAVRIGFKDSGEGSTLTCTDIVAPKKGCTRAGEYYVWSLSALGIETMDYHLHVPVPPAAKTHALDFLKSQGLKAGEPFICLCPATTWRQKHWVEERWSELADRFHDRHGIRSVILGGPADSAMAGRIVEKARSEPIVAAGKLHLKESAALVAAASLVVTVDTGLLFIAISQDTPAVGIFGPTVSGHLAAEPFVTVLQRPFPCAPCRRTRWTCADFDCMRAIEVDEVLQAAEARLAAAET